MNQIQRIERKNISRYLPSKNKSADRIYFNVQITNNGILKQEAVYNQSQTQPILGGVSQDYDLSIIRFKIPSQDIPIFNFEPQPGPTPTYQTWSNTITYSAGAKVTYLGLNYQSLGDSNLNHQPNISPKYWLPLGLLNNDPNLGIYSVTLTYNSTVVQVYLIYVVESFRSPPSSWLVVDPTNYDYYKIYSYQQFIDYINTALDTAYNNASLAGSPPRVASAPAPYLVFDPVTELISLKVDRSFDPTYVGAPTIKIYFNNVLFSFFQNFQIFRNAFNDPQGQDAQILVKDNGNNVVGSVYTMTQEYNSLYLWSIFNKIIVTSGAIPVQNEYSPLTPNGQVSDLNDFNQSALTTGQRPIVTDFETIIDLPRDNRSYISYYPQGPYRFITLRGNTDIKQVDFQYYWQDIYGYLYPLYILPGETLSMKILFQRKDVYYNNDALIN